MFADDGGRYRQAALDNFAENGSIMIAQIKHIAIVTDRYTLLARFYEAVFGLWTFPGRVEAAAMAVSDGHVGLNFNLRPPGRQAGIDHFGLEVEDVDTVLKRGAKYRGVDHLRRPSNRPFAGISMNDPAGNVFDLAHRDVKDRDSVYGTSAERKMTPRRMSHFVLRAVDPPMLADFYRDVFDLIEKPRTNSDPNFYLSDGTLTMVIAPWKITDYAGTGVARPAMDHLGFTVDNLDAFQSDLGRLAIANAALAPQTLADSPENTCRRDLLKKCALGKLHIADPDGNLIDIAADA
jgi:predicted enzyme related to lactoylglutathione lyase